MTWQSIESAPKDGTRILVYPILRHRPEQMDYKKVSVIAYWYAAGKHSYWVGLGVKREAKAILTHWMSLPQGPEK